MEKRFADIRGVWRMKRYLTLYAHLFRLSFIRRMEYRFDFFLNMLRSFGWLLIGMLGFSILFSQTSTIAGWNKHEAFLLYGLFVFINELWYALFFINITNIPRYVQYGQFDYLILLPVSLQFLVSLKEVLSFALPNAFFAIFIIVGQYVALGQSIGAGSLLVAVLLIINGLFILYSIMLLIATLSFWFVRLHAIWEVYQTITEGARYPVDLFKDPLHFIFVYVIPLAIIFTFPAQFLVKGLSWQLVVFSFMVGIGSFVVARKFFYYGIKHYDSASS